MNTYQKHHALPNRNKQKGIVLPIALVFLLISTLLGVSSLRSNAMSEKMTRNTIQRDIAFNKAETTLIEGEELVRLNAAVIKDAIFENPSSNDCSAAYDSNKGFCSPAKFPQEVAGTTPPAPSNVERWKINNLWTDTTSKRYLESSNGGKYIIEFVGHVLDANNESKCSNPADLVDWPYCDKDALQFRITALADGTIPGETRVMLQSTYIASPIPPTP